MDGALVGDDEGEFFHYFLIAEGLDPICTGSREDYVDEEADVIGESAGGEVDGRGLGCDEEIGSIGREYADLGLVAALAAPVIDDRELDQRYGQLLDHDVLEDPHYGDLIAHLDADVVTHQRVNQIQCL